MFSLKFLPVSMLTNSSRGINVANLLQPFDASRRHINILGQAMNTYVRAYIDVMNSRHYIVNQIIQNNYGQRLSFPIQLCEDVMYKYF